MSGIPLLRGTNRAAPFARRQGQTISLGTFLDDVAALATLLPATTHVVNLCQDRYRFAVGFAAALCRRQITILPPSETPAVLADILVGHDSVYGLVEAPMRLPMRYVVYPGELPAWGDSPMPVMESGQVAAILYTSGSTGRPQPHPRSWGLLVSSADSAGRETGADLLPGAALFGTVPHQHSYGLESLVLLAWRHGLVLHAERPFYPQDIVTQLAATPPPRVLVTTPVHLRVLLAEQTDLPPLDLLLSATAPLTTELACAAEEGFAAPLHEIYGCSEVGQIASRRTLHGEEWRCLDGIALRQREGATWAGGPAVARETRLADIIELRGSRHFRLLGRDGDLVNVAGKRSSLAALNAQLAAIAGVLDAAYVMAGETALGRPVLEAFVVAPGLGPAAIRTALRRRIDPAFLPRRVHVVNRLPRTALGKLTQAEICRLLSEANAG